MIKTSNHMVKSVTLVQKLSVVSFLFLHCCGYEGFIPTTCYYLTHCEGMVLRPLVSINQNSMTFE